MNNIIVFTFFSVLGSVMAQECYMLVPQPQQIYYNKGICDLPENSYVVIDAKKEEKDKLLSIAMTVKEELAPVYGELYISASKANKTSVIIRVAPEVSFRDQGYNLTIEPEKITISAGDCTGAFYALQTLKQIIRVSQGHLRCLKIKDWPDFPNRGVMLDISRDKVPSMDTLYLLVDTLAELKINQFQLYTEHTFAYQNHSIVWQDSSPMTSQQVLELDKYCKQRYIELVPNQNSFGHMSRWLKHEPYRQYAEAPDGCETAWGWYEAFSLCPIDPRSIELLSEMYDELLPNFSSQQFNVGCDETIDLGIVRSKQMCEEKGKGQVYLDFLLKIHQQLRMRDMTMMFWGDIIIKYPKLIEELPKDIVVLEWGYRADHPYNDRCKKYSQAALPYYVCPGTSTWNSVAGRTDNAVSNLLNAAENGIKYGAIGFLNTNWGDNGHWQPMSVCYLGYMYGAAVSWSVDRNKDIDIKRALNEHIFKDKNAIAGKLVYDLGNTYLIPHTEIHNASIIAKLLYEPDIDLTKNIYSSLNKENLRNTIDYIENVMAPLDKADINTDDADQIKSELIWASKILKHGCRLGIARLETPNKIIQEIPHSKKQILAKELKQRIAEFKVLWLARNRPGGLEDSLNSFSKMLDYYEKQD